MLLNGNGPALHPYAWTDGCQEEELFYISKDMDDIKYLLAFYLLNNNRSQKENRGESRSVEINLCLVYV